MREIIISFLTRENITLAIAIFGAVGAVCNWVQKQIDNKVSMDVHLLKAFKPGRSFVVYLSFQNRSRLPISINSVSVLIDGSAYQCELVPHSAFKKYNSGVLVSEIKTMTFPVNLSPLSGSAGFVEFAAPEEELRKLSTHLTLQVSTNRGNLPKKKFLLGDWDDVVSFL